MSDKVYTVVEPFGRRVANEALGLVAKRYQPGDEVTAEDICKVGGDPARLLITGAIKAGKPKKAKRAAKAEGAGDPDWGKPPPDDVDEVPDDGKPKPGAPPTIPLGKDK